MGRCSATARWLAAALLLGFAGAGCGQGGPEPAASARDGAGPKGPPPVPVLLAEAQTRRVESRLGQVGTLEASREVTLRSEVTGRVTRVLFAEGRPVREGEVLVRLDSRKIEAEIRTQEARIQQLRVRVENRRRDLERNPPLLEAEIRKLEEQSRQLAARLGSREREVERNRPLVEKDLVSRQTFDRLQSEIDELRAEMAQTQVELDRQRDLVSKQTVDRIQTEIAETEAEIAQAEATLARQRVLLADFAIRAPFDAVAGVRSVNLGDYVGAGGAVVAVVDLDPLEIAFQVPEKNKARLSLGQAVRLAVDAFPGRSFEGRISFIAPRVDTQTRTFPVKAEVRNPGHLLNPGMFAKVELVTEVREDALTVPWEAVIQTEGATYVYAVEGETARRVPVRLGETTGAWAEVLDSDLAPGAKVVLEGKFALKDGARVAVGTPAAKR